MLVFIVIGVISLVVGVMFLGAPEKLLQINDAANKLVSSIEVWIFSKNIGVGLSMIIASILFFFVAYYINLKG